MSEPAKDRAPFLADGTGIYLQAPGVPRRQVATAIRPALAHALAHATNLGLEVMGLRIADSMIADIFGDDPDTTP